MDFDKPKVYGDTSITDGLVFFAMAFFGTYGLWPLILVLAVVSAKRLDHWVYCVVGNFYSIVIADVRKIS